MKTAEEIANQLEDEIAGQGCSLTYDDIVKLSIVTAKKVLDNIAMYTGSLNPKWTLWDNIITELKSRQ